MTNEELLRRARVFDAGPPPVCNQFVLDEDDGEDSKTDSLTIEYRGSTGWAICSGSCCIDKETGYIEFESMPSERQKDFTKRTRFSTPQEAFAFLDEWKLKKREEALQLPFMIPWKKYKKGNFCGQ